MSIILSVSTDISNHKFGVFEELEEHLLMMHYFGGEVHALPPSPCQLLLLPHTALLSLISQTLPAAI